MIAGGRTTSGNPGNVLLVDAGYVNADVPVLRCGGEIPSQTN
jgi:hypothetical protein